MRSCGRLGLLATSREQLGVNGEIDWRVPCLSVPKEQDAVDSESLDSSEAVRCSGTAHAPVRPNFGVTDDNAQAVAAICQRLDGIPLAIELAAARAGMMSAERIAEALADRFHLLSGSTRSAVPRQATLRASVNWSYELLPEPDRALLRRLSVFAGGLTLEAASAVGADGEVGGYEVLGLLSALVDKSLAQVNGKGTAPAARNDQGVRGRGAGCLWRGARRPQPPPGVLRRARRACRSWHGYLGDLVIARRARRRAGQPAARRSTGASPPGSPTPALASSARSSSFSIPVAFGSRGCAVARGRPTPTASPRPAAPSFTAAQRGWRRTPISLRRSASVRLRPTSGGSWVTTESWPGA